MCKDGTFENAGVCKECVEGGICDGDGVTLASLGVRPGYWRGSTTTDEVYECFRKENCKGAAGPSATNATGDTWAPPEPTPAPSSSRRRLMMADATPAGDALCTAHAKGILCNDCATGRARTGRVDAAATT